MANGSEQEKITQIVIAGHDGNNGFGKTAKMLEAQGCIVLTPENTGNVNYDIIEAIRKIEGKKDITIMSHGGEQATFHWVDHKVQAEQGKPETGAQSIPYYLLLEGLEGQNINHIHIAGCHGESVMEHAAASTPKGATLTASVSADSYGYRPIQEHLVSNTTKNGAQGVSSFELALNNFDENKFGLVGFANRLNLDGNQADNSERSNPLKTNAQGVMPNSIYIGGKGRVLLEQTINQGVVISPAAVEMVQTAFHDGNLSDKTTDKRIEQLAEKISGGQVNTSELSIKELATAKALVTAEMKVSNGEGGVYYQGERSHDVLGKAETNVIEPKSFAVNTAKIAAEMNSAQTPNSTPAQKPTEVAAVQANNIENGRV